MRLQWACLSGLVAIGLFSFGVEVNAQAVSAELAQRGDLGCRRVNARTGLYAQPNLSSASQGVLPQAQIVRLESAARGWARITQPRVGWVEASYLSPPIACDARIAPPATPMSTRPSGDSSPRPTPLPPLVISKPASTTLTVICRVVPPNGLVVRREPSLDDGLFITSLAPGEHAFRFTGQTTRTQTSLGTLTWLYITAPREGWITAGYVGQPPTLTGDRCG